MRLHHLRVRAFGPFGDTEDVDFDSLHEAGLFLLSGPTGAGKTSLLDAVCFALYGRVPGVRDERALRSQHAADGVAPLVELELTVRGRRLRLRRTPEWVRPKRRGDGTTVERAAVTLHEIRGDAEVLLSSRAQEVGHEIGLLLGMTATQFQQVAMLPQGRFHQFLLADSEERQAVLTRLFGTQRFSAIEEWIAEHSRATTRRAEELRAQADKRLHSLADRAGVEAPPAAPVPEETATSWRAWSTDLLGRLADDHTRATARLDQARAQLAAARTTCAAAEDWARWWTRRATAEERAARVAAQQDALDAAREALTAHEAARALRPLLTEHDETRERRAAALRRAGLPDLEVPSDGPSDGDALADPEAHTEAEVERLTARLAVLDDLRPAVTEVERARRESASARRRLDETRTALAGVRREAAALPALREDADRALREAQDALAAEPALAAEVARAEEVADAARAVADLQRAHDTATARVRAAQEADVAALDHLRRVVEARLRGMAAELARDLTEGEPCAVCGSTSHPAPAPSDDDAVDAEAHMAAEAARAATAAAVADARRDLEESAARLTAVRLAAQDLSTVEADAALSAARARLAELAAVRQSLPDLRDRTTRLAAAAERLAAQESDLSARVEEASRSLAAVEARAADTTDRVRALLDGTGGPGLDATDLDATDLDGTDLEGAGTDLVAALETERDAVAADLAAARTRLGAVRDARAAVTDHLRAERRLAGPLADAGFADARAATAALLDETDHARIRGQVAAAEAAAQEAAAVLREPAPVDVVVPDPGDAEAAARAAEAARAAVAAAEEQVQAAERVQATTAETRTAADDLATRLDDAIANWLPVAEEQRHADGLSRLVRGTSADNRLQMRLSAYVLATRLDQVVEAANLRLVRMRDRRFLLRRTDRAASRRTRAGLDLEVLDQWTGVARSPSSLSGGEMFVVALTLALGLADVIAHESGGVELETLFIDEGFGMLDADTLDDVLDRLDELRAGGRSVGVVSHVSEMRARIPVQVRVEKTRSGSRVTSPHDLSRSLPSR